MKQALSSRRVIIAVLGILTLFVLGLYVRNAEAVAMPLATICVGIAGANAFEAGKKKE